MSYGSMFTIHDDGSIKKLAEFRNAWGMAPAVWQVLCGKYFGDEHLWLCNRKDIDKLWHLYKDPRLSDSDVAALLFTFDYATITFDSRKRVAELLLEFSPQIDPKVINHLPSVAQYLIELPECVATCFQQTSVSSNPWFAYDESKDESVPYNFKTGTKHFDILSTVIDPIRREQKPIPKGNQ